MKNEKFYEDWKKHKSQIDVGPNFTEKVMRQVYQYQQKKKSSLFDFKWLVEIITAHPSVQAAMIAIGAVVGFIRLVIMLHVLLYT